MACSEQTRGEPQKEKAPTCGALKKSASRRDAFLGW
jgi:hypothetical protein